MGGRFDLYRHPTNYRAVWYRLPLGLRRGLAGPWGHGITESGRLMTLKCSILRVVPAATLQATIACPVRVVARRCLSPFRECSRRRVSRATRSRLAPSHPGTSTLRSRSAKSTSRCSLGRDPPSRLAPGLKALGPSPAVKAADGSFGMPATQQPMRLWVLLRLPERDER